MNRNNVQLSDKKTVLPGNVAEQENEHGYEMNNVDKNKYLEMYQGIKRSYPKDVHILELIKESVEKYPEQLAVQTLTDKVTYAEFWRYTNVLASRLREHGVAAHDRVAIVANRTIETVICIYATLLAGASYVPIERDYPRERFEYIVKDSESKLLLLPYGTEKFKMEDVNSLEVSLKQIAQSEDSITINLPCPESACYVIYTSGTTGKPKGVEINNESLINLCNWFVNEVSLVNDSRLLLLNPFGFDASVKNIFSPFLVGATLYLGPEVLFDIDKILLIIRKYQITHMNSVPRLFYALLDASTSDDLRELCSLKQVIVGGEALDAKPLIRWAESDLKLSILNVYGPTECTSVTSCYRVTKDLVKRNDRIPIGKPIDNKRVYILNAQKELCPEGVTGELFISGVGIAGHYISESAKNLTVFQQDIFDKDLVMYQSGDLVQWNSVGELIYLGRNDSQVKVDGHRIELSEIEKVLSSNSSVKECKVLLNKSNNVESLVAFLIMVPDKVLDRTEMKEYLAKYLPDYMIPKKMMECESFPLTANGKVDRKKLLMQLENKGQAAVQKEKKHASKEEETLQNIWLEELQADYLSNDVNFFDAGGKSLMLPRLLHKIEDAFHIKISITDLLIYTTISSQAEQIKRLQEGEMSSTSSNQTKEVETQKRKRTARKHR